MHLAWVLAMLIGKLDPLSKLKVVAELEAVSLSLSILLKDSVLLSVPVAAGIRRRFDGVLVAVVEEVQRVVFEGALLVVQE